jgi:hypothetical protein
MGQIARRGKIPSGWEKPILCMGCCGQLKCADLRLGRGALRLAAGVCCAQQFIWLRIINRPPEHSVVLIVVAAQRNARKPIVCPPQVILQQGEEYCRLLLFVIIELPEALNSRQLLASACSAHAQRPMPPCVRRSLEWRGGFERQAVNATRHIPFLACMPQGSTQDRSKASQHDSDSVSAGMAVRSEPAAGHRV